MELYHGTDPESARRLTTGESLDFDRATALKIDGPPGFYLASEIGDAEFFAARRGQGAVMCFEVSPEAFHELVRAGARYQPVPRSADSPWFAGDELFVPPAAFAVYNRLLRAGSIRPKPL
jgi:hypothetical protein